MKQSSISEIKKIWKISNGLQIFQIESNQDNFHLNCLSFKFTNV